MKDFRHVAVLLAAAAFLASGCTSSSPAGQGPAAPEAEKNFSEIVQFWRARFPEGNFHYPPLRDIDGPSDNLRLHISVPPEMLSQYQFPYTVEFLEARRAQGDDLSKSTADDLLMLKRPLLSKPQGGAKVSYDGGKHEVECDDFVVPWKE